MSIKSIKTGYTGISALAGNPAYGDFESIATYAVTSGTTSTITFSSIPSTFQHLQIRGYVITTSSGASPRIRFNSDSGSNYSQHQIYGDGGGAASTGSGSQTFASIAITNGATTSPTVDVVDILDYSNSNKNTTVRSLGGYDANGSGYVTFRSDGWFNTAVVTTIELTLTAGSFDTNTRFALYGIR